MPIFSPLIAAVNCLQRNRFGYKIWANNQQLILDLKMSIKASTSSVGHYYAPLNTKQMIVIRVECSCWRCENNLL